MMKTYKTRKLYTSLYGRAAYEVWKSAGEKIAADGKLSGSFGKILAAA